MSVGDYMSGAAGERIASNLVRQREWDSFNRTLQQWRNYADGLERDLAQVKQQLADEKIHCMIAKARSAGRDELVDRLKAALATLDPDNAMLSEIERMTACILGVDRYLEAQGYRWDWRAEKLHKLEK